jgi:hypothetical protein
MDGRRKRDLGQLKLFLLIAGQRLAQDLWIAVGWFQSEIVGRAQIEQLDEIVVGRRQIGGFGIKPLRRSAQRLCHYQIGVRRHQVAQQRNPLAQ